ncbi:hypothetical protein [Methanohalophilus sp.]
MSRSRFSKDYRTYGDWLKAQPRTTKYAKEIIRKHQYFPDRNLKSLRQLKIGSYDFSKKDWNDLSAEEKADRNLSFDLLREMRNGKNLTEATSKVGVNKQFALKHLGTYLQKKGGKWEVTRTDSIQSEMMIYTEDKGVSSIVVTNAKDRSKIGKYLSAVGKALKSGDTSLLEKFKDMKIKDANGNESRFEIDLDKLYDIRETIEEPEFLEIYRS